MEVVAGGVQGQITLFYSVGIRVELGTKYHGKDS